MKKLLLLLIIPIIVSAQVRLSYTIDEIKSEFSSSEYHMKTGVNHNKKYISVDLEMATMIYYFNDDMKSDVNFIIPYNDTASLFFIQYNNKVGTYVGKGKWVSKKAGYTVNIELIKPATGRSFFKWSYSEEYYK